MTAYAQKISSLPIGSIAKISSLNKSLIHSISTILILHSVAGDVVKIAAGLSVAAIIRTTFTSNNISTWGRGTYGGLGTNTNNAQQYLSEIAGSSKTFCEISGQQFGFSAIDKNGNIWSWGYNNYGQIGDNTVVCRSTPVAVQGSNKTFCKISLGLYHGVAIEKNGMIWAWGQNSNAQLGDNSIVNKSTPVTILGTTKTFCQISATYSWTLGIDKDGKAWSWGYNRYGQLGDNTVISKRTPIAVLGVNKTFCKISGYQTHSMGLDKNGDVWCWGYNNFGHLGTNSTASVRTPRKVSGVNKTFCKIATGEAVSHAIDKNGMIWSWGYNMWGKLGDGTTNNRSTPTAVGGTTRTFCDISGGQFYSIALDNNNNVWGWGNTDYLNDIPIKPMMSTGIKINLLSAGTNASMGLFSTNDRLYMWGNNTSGNLGINLGSGSRRSPQLVGGATRTFCKISNWNYTSSGIDRYGKVWTWGSNATGQLGINSVVCRSTPVAILGVNKTFCAISAGVSYISAIDIYGEVWSWGYNSQGQLGDNSITCRSTPVAVQGVKKTFAKLSSGNYTIALTISGIAWAWGVGTSGCLGTGDTSSRRTPTQVSGVLKTFCEISCSAYNHTLAIDKYGKIWAWGTNSYGGLGDGSASSRLTPVALYGDRTFCKISAGYYASAAIDYTGQIWTWGYNQGGCLGDNTLVSKRTPIRPFNIDNKTFCHISSGTNYVIAADNNNDVYAWGYNQNGQFGYDYVALTPIKIII